MDPDSDALRSGRGEHSDSLDGLYPVAQWYDPCERAFQGSDDLESCFLWATRSASALGRLRTNLIRFALEQTLDFEALASAGHSFSFITAIAALTTAQIELLPLQVTLGEVTEKLAARRLLEFGDEGARSSVCGRPCPSALDGLLDVHKRVNVLIYPLGHPVISAVAAVIPNVMSRTPHLAPFYAGRAENVSFRRACKKRPDECQGQGDSKH
jgi:hypothetical protein